MRRHLKPLSEQVMVITGATSGIGLVTARHAAARGARLVLAARNQEALEDLKQELTAQDCEVICVPADVGVEADVRRLAASAIAHFGGYDTWVNNAAISVYGKLEDVAIADQRRVFDTNFWGVVYGSLIACEHLREHGGKLINVGSVLSERAVPIQGIYSASKAAEMGYTDALRMELEQDHAPVSVTLIKPAAIDTPYKEHAANYLATRPKNPPPVYAPEVVADAILFAAEHHIRDIVVGGSGKVLTTVGNAFPRLTDKLMTRLMPWLQRTREPDPGISKGSLYQPGEDGRERSSYSAVLPHSMYTSASKHRMMSATLVVAVLLVMFVYAVSRSSHRRALAADILRALSQVKGRFAGATADLPQHSWTRSRLSRLGKLSIRQSR